MENYETPSYLSFFFFSTLLNNNFQIHKQNSILAMFYLT